MNIPAFTVLGGGPTVLMLHGAGGGHLSFAPQVETGRDRRPQLVGVYLAIEHDDLARVPGDGRGGDG